MTYLHAAQCHLFDRFAQSPPLKIKAPREGFAHCLECNGSGVRAGRCCDECGGLGHSLLPEFRA